MKSELIDKIMHGHKQDGTHLKYYINHTVQRLMLSKGAKRTKFYHISVILQYRWDKTIARSGDMYRDDSGILSLVIICLGITNISLFEFPLLC